MPRPPNVRHANSKSSISDRIIEESVRLFVQKGFKGTTIKDITDSVNLTRGAIYWHFKSKDELLKTIIQYYDRTYMDGLVKSVRSHNGDFLSKFKQYHKYSTEFVLQYRDLCMVFTILAAELTGSGARAEAQINRVLAKYRGFLSDLLSIGKQEQVLDEDLDIPITAEVIIGMHNGILLQWYMRHKAVDSKELARIFRNVMLYGIMKAKAPKALQQPSL